MSEAGVALSHVSLSWAGCLSYHWLLSRFEAYCFLYFVGTEASSEPLSYWCKPCEPLPEQDASDECLQAGSSRFRCRHESG